MPDKYTEGYDAKPAKPLYAAGEKLQTIVARAEIAVADADGQLYVLARGIPIDATLVNALVPKGHDAVTGGNDYDLGVYKNTGTYASPTWTAVDKDIFFDGVDMSSARTSAVDLATSETDSTIAELCSIATEDQSAEYAIVLTANTVGSAAVDIEFNINLAPAH